MTAITNWFYFVRGGYQVFLRRGEVDTIKKKQHHYQFYEIKMHVA